jgi:hypothetical protein
MIIVAFLALIGEGSSKTCFGFNGMPDFSNDSQWKFLRQEPLLHIQNKVTYIWGAVKIFQMVADSRTVGFERESLTGEVFYREIQEMALTILDKPKTIFLGVKRKGEEKWEIGTSESWWELQVQITHNVFIGLWFDIHITSDERYGRFFSAKIYRHEKSPVPSPRLPTKGTPSL